MTQKTRKQKLANIGFAAQPVNPSVETIAQQQEEIEQLKFSISEFVKDIEHYKTQIHRLNSQVGGYKKNLSDSKDTIKALNADVNGLKATNLSINNARQSLVRKVEANDAYISQLAKDLRISKDKVISLASELKSIKCKWLYKLFN